MNLRRMWTVARTDLKQLIQARDYWIPMVALGALFFLVVPAILLLTIRNIGEVTMVQQISDTLKVLPKAAQAQIQGSTPEAKTSYALSVFLFAPIAVVVPLTISTAGHFTEAQIGIIPTSETIFSYWNLIICAALFIVIPIANRMMMPDDHEMVIVDPAKLRDAPEEALPASPTPAQRLENSRILMWVVGIPGLIWLGLHFAGGGGLNLNVVNMTFLFLGIVLHGTARSLLAALDQAVKGGAGIVIQFPFYAGIMAIMTGSGLAASLSEFFVSISSAETLPFWSFIAGGIVNIFVPSGGGQWAVQAPVMLPAAEALGASIPRVAMGVAWGDAWTNLLQPFWALPMLGIAGLKARDIMGYCVVMLLVTGVVIGAGLLLL